MSLGTHPTAPLPFSGLGTHLTASVLHAAQALRMQACPRANECLSRHRLTAFSPCPAAGYERLVLLGREIRGS